ncbi:MAG: ATP-binding cassette domain-containing protein [Vicinamibacteria bacterium]|jgi:putative ABC transport system ATP-binding protein|nr:ATP-binding cassette domain-containing protein [Vicinamibacteria bacterium]
MSNQPIDEEVPFACVHGVSYAFGEGEARKQVLFENDAELLPAELAILSGPSGSGKTTLLSLIGALRAMQQGSIRVGARELSTLTSEALLDYRRSLGFIFQHHNLFPALTALESVQMALDLLPLSPVEKRSRAAQMLERLGLGARLDYKPEKLSGGQRQRVAIARALVHRPQLVLADEPTAALDKDTAHSVLDVIRELVREERTTVLMVTHDTRLLHAADRIVHMVDGRIVSNVRVAHLLEVCEYLRKSKLFLARTPAEYTEIAQKMTLARYPAGVTLIRQGDEGDRFCIVRNGTVEVLREEAGAQRSMAVLKRGDYFGERALIIKEPRNATVVTREPSEIFSLAKEDFEAAIARSATFQDQLLTGVFRRL